MRLSFERAIESSLGRSLFRGRAGRTLWRVRSGLSGVDNIFASGYQWPELGVEIVRKLNFVAHLPLRRKREKKPYIVEGITFFTHVRGRDGIAQRRAATYFKNAMTNGVIFGSNCYPDNQLTQMRRSAS